MNMRRLPFVLALTVSGWAVACSDTPQADNPPQPTGTATASAAPTVMETAAPTATAAVTAAPTATAEAVTPPPVVKTGKEKIVGKWQFSFEGEPKAKAEEEGKKKFAKEKDTKKFDAYMKGIEEAAAGEWVEFTADTYTSHVTEKGKDKVVFEGKFEIVKDDNTTLVAKPGKDKPKVGKAPPAGTEITTTFKDDNTIEMMDPGKKMKLVFKRKM